MFNSKENSENRKSEHTRSTKSKFSNLDTFTSVAMFIRLINLVYICHCLYSYVRCTSRKSSDFWQKQIDFITYFSPYFRFNRKLFAFYVILQRFLVFHFAYFLYFSLSSSFLSHSTNRFISFELFHINVQILMFINCSKPNKLLSAEFYSLCSHSFTISFLLSQSFCLSLCSSHFIRWPALHTNTTQTSIN